MNDFLDTHTPSPEFRAALERDLMGALRRETRFAPYNRIARSARVRTVMLIVVGAVLGVGCGYASAQVRESQTRSELLMAAEASLKLAALRLDIARNSLAESRKQFDAGVITRREVSAFETQMRTMEVNLARVNLDMEEIRASAAPPREELWAPLVSGRDFVKQRLELEAGLAQQRLAEAEAQLKEADGRVRTGVAGAITMYEAQTVLLEAQRAFESIAQRLALRRQFLEENLRAEDIASRQKLLEMQVELAIARARSQTAEQRVSVTRDRVAVGAASKTDLMRAQLELMELMDAIQMLQLQLKLFQGSKRSP